VTRPRTRNVGAGRAELRWRRTERNVREHLQSVEIAPSDTAHLGATPDADPDSSVTRNNTAFDTTVPAIGSLL
jgi:hypothetical protein